MSGHDLASTALQLVAKGKGILAADESTRTIKKRLDSINMESTEDNRRNYRDMLFTSSNIADTISGVILYDETIRQNSREGTPFHKMLTDKGILPGIKVDTGAKDLALHAGEKVTEGLDGLRERLNEYREQWGARFAKWRAVITIGDGIPSQACLNVNANALARYAALCQEAHIVPIVEPEVLMDGDHSLERCERVTTRTLITVFAALANQGVSLEGMLLKPNMVISGKTNANRADVQAVAEATIRCFKRTVPAAVPGIVFLSGGQSPDEATAHLNAMNAMGPHPWALSFSYGRALQSEALSTWAGKEENVGKAQEAFQVRAKACSDAAQGTWKAA